MRNRFDLDEEQLKKFKEIHGNKYGGSGALMGMCMNQAIETAQDVEGILKQALDLQIRADMTCKLVPIKEISGNNEYDVLEF